MISKSKNKEVRQKSEMGVPVLNNPSQQIGSQWGQNWLCFGQGFFYIAWALLIMSVATILVFAYFNGVLGANDILNILTQITASLLHI
ncbi:hypothetical protein NHM07_20760 [Bacillus subtilis]|uniref:hypothetical protein n=1 Tax=Bacillus subtilis TaxID=1423 RepID=UPI00209B1E34|nr:hypothetical protein [Bacillus subtilis]MCO8150928.1 hypothetical protein [Bacillus subtilis]